MQYTHMEPENREIIEEIAGAIRGSHIVDFAYEYDCTTTRGVRLWFTLLKLRNASSLPVVLDTGGFCLEDEGELGEAGIALFIRGNRYSPDSGVGVDLIDQAVGRDLVMLFDGAEVTKLETLSYGSLPCLERDGLSFYPLKADVIHCITPEGIPFSFRAEGFCPTNPIHRTKTWITLDAQLMVDEAGAGALVSDEFFSEFASEDT